MDSHITSLKVAFIGAVKSGKSKLAEKKTLKLSRNKTPIYLATNEFFDDEMRQRVEIHKKRREKNFHTIEEPLDILSVISNADSPVLVECLTVWINNMIYHQKTDDDIISVVKQVLELDRTIIFVINEVGFGILPENKLARRFVNISGAVSQLLGESCDEVYFCTAGLSLQMK